MSKPLLCFVSLLVVRLCLAQNTQQDTQVDPRRQYSSGASQGNSPLAAASLATVSLSGSASATLPDIGGIAFVFNGMGTISGLGNLTLAGTGTIDSLTGPTSRPITGSFTLTFQGGDTLTATFSIPAGVLIPFIGGSTSSTGTITITGGTGKYAGASGSFQSVTGTGTSTGAASLTFQLTGSGTISLPGGTGGTPTARTLAHAADGNNFKTAILLVNSDTAPAPYTVHFYDDAGNPPASRFELESGFLTGTIQPGKSVTIRTAGKGTQTVSGWADLTAPATVGGSVIYSQPDPPRVQEGTVTITSAGSQHFFLPFDNTSSAITGIAITNSGTVSANVTVTLRYDSGNSETVPWGTPMGSRTHRALAISTQFPHSAGQSGVAEFVSDQPLYGVVFRFNSSQAFTSLGIVSQ